ncbi:hypothetical protein ACH5RR_023907 [Cinchona calisaya]|uniref:Xylanase inhibitor C-terminal domain-containing protein n=1 Tax=Cinchona calisaya TaxID=153742 RepID=A0ABD2ZFE7_9GENT
MDPAHQALRRSKILLIRESLMDDEARVRSLNFKKVSKSYSKGTPKVDCQVIIDTGSDYAWGIEDVTNYPLSVEPSDMFENFQFGCRLINNGGPDNFANGAGYLDSCTWSSFHLQRNSVRLRNSYYLPESIYIALRTAFKQSMAKYPLAAAQEKLDTCYNFKGFSRIRLPYIVFRFGSGTDLSLNSSRIVFIPQKNTDVWCLGFAAIKMSDDLTIICNNQKRGLDILFDMDAGRIGFGTKPYGGLANKSSAVILNLCNSL